MDEKRPTLWPQSLRTQILEAFPRGANRCDTYVNEITAGLVDAKADPVVEQCSDGCAVIHGHNGLGAVTAHLAMKTALQLARDHGVAVVTCHSSNHYGAAGFWAIMALDEI